MKTEEHFPIMKDHRATENPTANRPHTSKQQSKVNGLHLWLAVKKDGRVTMKLKLTKILKYKNPTQYN